MRLKLFSVSSSISSNFQNLSFHKIKTQKTCQDLNNLGMSLFLLHVFDFCAWLYCFSWITPLKLERAGGIVMVTR